MLTNKQTYFAALQNILHCAYTRYFAFEMLEDDFPQFFGKNGMMGLDDIDDITFIHFRPWLQTLRKLNTHLDEDKVGIKK